MATSYPKRLIEVDLPIKRISAHARREKSIRHGHISTLHIWWARRPLAACRAVICAALWPDPADPLCPEPFREAARTQMLRWTTEYRRLLSQESLKRFHTLVKDPNRLDDPLELRQALLDFIADFANWDNSTSKEYLETSRMLTQAAHEALGGEPGTKPLVVDPFAGGAAIPLEALRVGADAFASDLNPVAVLLNKVVLEYIPKYGQQLADEVRKWGQWVKAEAEQELAEFYPTDPVGATPIAYLWARTIRCEGPGCGVEIPLMRSLWLAKRGTSSVALRLIADTANKQIDFDIINNVKGSDVREGTIRKGSATCPICGYTTPNLRVRTQLMERSGGAQDARLFAVVTIRPDEQGRFYRLPTQADLDAVHKAERELKLRITRHEGSLSLVPDENIPPERPSPNARGLSAITRMGVNKFADIFTPRQALALTTLQSLIQRASEILTENFDPDLAKAVKTCLALMLDRQVDATTSLCKWHLTGEKHTATFGRQALPIVWDFSEVSVISEATGGFSGAVEWVSKVCEANTILHDEQGHVESSSATAHPLPDASAQAIITDPPYYDAVPYADLSDFFYVWLRRSLATEYPELFSKSATPKDEEAIWNPSRIYSLTGKPKDQAFYEMQMSKALAEGWRITVPNGIGVVVFAHKSTAGWEAILSALINAGWSAVASWPIDTEMGSRINAMGTASLASSIHIISRPRISRGIDEIGDWRDVLDQLPIRVKEWMPRLVAEGVVGADAIFACLGPAMEIFSRYSRVEKASGEQVTLREYLEYVWAAVAREALSQIFEGVDTTGFDEDARITALWLWTLFSGTNELVEPTHEEESEEDEEAPGSTSSPSGGYVLEYDAARKIAQGLGVHLERLPTVVEVKGEKARLLPVAERVRSLFGKEAAQPVTAKRKKNVVQAAFPGWSTQLVQGEIGWGTGQTAETDEAALADRSTPKAGETVLDRLHQSMLLFSVGRTEALKRFLVEDGIGQDQRFWRLAQALSALYPMGSDEKRWVDGVLARKKGWGL